MNENKKRFELFLKELRPEEAHKLMGVFEHYHKLLEKYNKEVNLISRKMPPDHYWVHHFLDSLMIMKCLDLSDKAILDFGTGAGLPGIPLKILNPECEMVLLDSIAKKVKVLAEMVEALGLPKTGVECSRLEDYAYLVRRPSFDYILCRAVALEERYYSPLRKLLKPSGKLIMYKSKSLSDLQGIAYKEIYGYADELLGERRFIRIAQRELLKR